MMITMRHILHAFLVGLGLAAGVQTVAAQPAPQPSQQAGSAFALPPESVTITATKPSDETIRSFVEARAQPTYVLGRMARWNKRICPVTMGLGEKYAKYVTQRIRDIATAVGAPVDGDPSCRPNIEVMFTLNPQILMNNVRKNQPLLLGYHHNEREADQLAKINHSIQAWYATVTQDLKGMTQVDTGTCGSGITSLNTMTVEAATMPGQGMTPPGSYELSLPCAIVVRSTGSRARDGLDSGFFNIVIVADPPRLFDYEVGSLADYIAMMALSQPASLDTCQDLPSISNLLAKGCASVPGWITDGDLAYLKGLYRVPSGYAMSAQRNELQYQMKKTLVTDKGG